MPQEIRKFGTAALLASTFALAGCFGGGSGVSTTPGGPGPIVTIPDPEGEPTGPIEAPIQATYSGDMAATFENAGDATGTTTISGTLTLEIDTEATTQIEASATGFSGVDTDPVDGGTFDLDGTLTGTGTVDLVAGSVAFGLDGRVNLAGTPSEGADVSLDGIGTFFGDDADQIDGTLAGTIGGEDDDGVWEDEGTGTFLLLKD